ncbi:hypothetical protein C2E23DRAFT_725823 [Lenzites betulinus]|nr:hypothetical protein C2E23DRAFT_725823 [Lenzites betulinus]
MARRPKVPTALHSELTEYSSLLRALKTSSTLDLVQHLAEPPPTSLRASSDLDDVSLPDEDLQERSDDPPLTESVSRDITSEVGSSIRSRVSSQTRERLPSGKAKQRDTWTRWPLLSGDVHVPEWSLQDEVMYTAQEALASLEATAAAKREVPDEGLKSKEEIEPSSDLSDEEAGEALALSPVALRAMTADSAAFLARILALLAAHVPNAEKSMQNRLRPINWETVIDIACAHDVISVEMANSVRSRMACMYAPSQPSAIQRINSLSVPRANLAHRLSELDSSLLDPPKNGSQGKAPRKRSKKQDDPSSEPRPPKRQRSKKGSRVYAASLSQTAVQQ